MLKSLLGSTKSSTGRVLDIADVNYIEIDYSHFSKYNKICICRKHATAPVCAVHYRLLCFGCHAATFLMKCCVVDK